MADDLDLDTIEADARYWLGEMLDQTKTRDAVLALVAEVRRLRAIEEWAEDAPHHPGCSGGYGLGYRCKCGRREIWPDPDEADRG